jgi:hypothetical protein
MRKGKRAPLPLCEAMGSDVDVARVQDGKRVESSRQLAWKESYGSVAENKERMRKNLGVVNGRILSRLQPGEKGISLGRELMGCGCSSVPGRNGEVLQVTGPKN